MNYQEFFARTEIVNKYADSIEAIGLWNSEKIPLLKYVPKEAHILDIGTGAGRVAFNLYQLGYYNVTATDFCNEILQKAIEHNDNINSNIKFIWDDITDCKLDSNQFDTIIFSFNGLIIIPSDDKRKLALWHINRLLKDNGIFIFSTDNRRTNKDFRWLWNSELTKWKHNKQDQRVSHFGEMIYPTEKGEMYFHHYRPEELVELLNRHGFKVLEDFIVGKKYEESQEVLNFCGDSHMWVCRKY